MDNGCPACSELTNSVEQSSSWETNRLSVTQEILGILWNPTVHYLVHNSLPLVPVLSHLNSLNALPCGAYKIHFNVLSSIAVSSKLSFHCSFHHQNPAFPIRSTCPTHLIPLNLMTVVRRPRSRWVNNIKTDLQEVRCGYMDWIGLAKDRDRWRTLVSVVMNLRVP